MMSIPIISSRTASLPPDVSTAPRLLGTTASVLVLGLLLFSARIITRARPAPNLGWDDYTMTAAVVFSLVSWSLVVASIPYGTGRHMYYKSQASNSRAALLIVCSQPTWLWANTLVKVSVACMLLRIKQNAIWKWFLYGAIAVQVASAIGTTVTLFTECKPFQTLWDPTIPGGYCSLIQIKESMYVNLSINLTEDLIFSLLPLTFIRMMHVPLREKLVLTVVMGMGLLASAATVVRLTLIKGYGVDGDFSWDNSPMAMWSHLECDIGIAAACIPCLKSPFEKVLRHAGLLSPRDSTVVYRNHKYLPHSENVQMQSWRGSMHQGSQRAKPPYAHSQESILEERRVSFTALDHGIMKTTEVHLSSRTAEVPFDWKHGED